MACSPSLRSGEALATSLCLANAAVLVQSRAARIVRLRIPSLPGHTGGRRLLGSNIEERLRCGKEDRAGKYADSGYLLERLRFSDYFPTLRDFDSAA
jgi:hypothetical protein